ncbi:MAG: glycosyltransferase family 2 protein [Cytophagaceae bacterium]|nr:glycosyltransferase family 2 protein [Cytophagaceae bacterium]
MIIDEFIGFWSNAGSWKALRVFWYFFAFELGRYVFFDFIVVLVYKCNRYLKHEDRVIAKEKLWAELPFVSVIVPGKNEGKHIYKLVRSLSEQTYKNFEIIVVDDGSSDKTALIGRDMERNGLVSLFLSNEVRGGKASAANLAFRYAKGKYVLHLDADCSFHRDAIENSLFPFYMDPQLGAVGGNLEVRDPGKNICTSLQAIEYLKTIGIGRMVTSYLGIYSIISGAFGMFRKDVLDQVKGWDIGPGLDGDITMKIRKLGYKVHFEPTAIGLTSVPNTFGKLAKQRLRWNKSIVRFRMRKHKDVFSPGAHFRFINFFASAENIFFNVILNILWYVHVSDMIVNFSDLLIYILPMNLLLYTLANFLQFWVVLMFSADYKNRLSLIPYLPLMVFYNGYYMRIIKTLAHFREMFLWSSYNDPWNPSKSSQQAKRLKL